MRQRLRTAFVLLLLAALPVAAQTTTATITGTVRDNSGAVIAGANVTARNVQTGVERAVPASGQGDFVIPYLIPGMYRVEAEAAGFKRAVVDSVELAVEQRARVDLMLEIGTVQEVVEVRASAPVVNSETSSVGQVVATQQIVDTPLKGRAFYELLQLAPAVTPKMPSSFVARSRPYPGGLQAPAFQVGGARENSNGYLIDGITAMDPHYQAPSFSPPVDAIQEFKLQTSTYSAEFGRSASQVNAATRSGTNVLHGTAYEFLRNQVLDATPFFTNLTGQRKAPLRYNLFGSTLGGPVVIPKLYNGRNKTFFFLNWELTRIRRGSTAQLSVPSAAQRDGDFSELGFRANRPIYDPLTTRSNGAGGFLRDPFPNNMIPAGRITEFGKIVTGLYPLPSLSTATGNNYSVNLSDLSDNNQGLFRIDQTLDRRNTVFFRFSKVGGEETQRSAVPADGTFNDVRNTNIAFSLITTITPTLLIELRLGWNRPENLQLQNGANENDLPRKLGLKNLVPDALAWGLPSFTLAGFSSMGSNSVPLTQITNIYQLVDHVTWIRGGHTLKTGIDFRRIHYTNREDRNSRGAFNFSGDMTALPGRSSSTGVSVADLLLGLPLTAQGSSTTIAGNFNNYSYAYFVQDDFKATSRLTLNLGLRYDYNTRYTDTRNRLTLFDSEYPGGRLLIAGSSQAYIPGRGIVEGPATPPGLIDPMTKNFQPRVGFAYRPFNNNSTVVRGGYGIFWDTIELQDLRTFVRNPPFGASSDLRTDINGLATAPGVLRVSDLFPAAGTLGARPTVYSPTTRYPDPYYQQWNVGIERELPKSLKVEIAYLGSKGTHLAQRLNLAQTRLDADPSRPTTVLSRQLYPLFGNTIRITDPSANSSYHAGYIKAERRFANGVSLLTSYTWSKSLDSSGLIDEQPRDIYNLALNKSRSSSDVRHRFVGNALWELPFGKGQRWLTGGVGNAILGGWQWNTTVTLRTGFPFGVTSPGDPCNCNGRSQTGNQIGDPWAGDVHRRERWFNTAAFVIPASGTFGSSGRNILDGPGGETVNFSVFRNIRLTEQFKLQFRGEFFNLFNHTNFDPPNAQINSPTYGVITSADDPRNIQFGLKLIF